MVTFIQKFSNVIVRLADLRFLMLFMSAMDIIIGGSCLKELSCEIFAEKSVDKILSGYVYARVVHMYVRFEWTDNWEELFALGTVIDSS